MNARCTYEMPSIWHPIYYILIVILSLLFLTLYEDSMTWRVTFFISWNIPWHDLPVVNFRSSPSPGLRFSCTGASSFTSEVCSDSSKSFALLCLDCFWNLLILQIEDHSNKFRNNKVNSSRTCGYPNTYILWSVSLLKFLVGWLFASFFFDRLHLQKKMWTN